LVLSFIDAPFPRLELQNPHFIAVPFDGSDAGPWANAPPAATVTSDTPVSTIRRIRAGKRVLYFSTAAERVVTVFHSHQLPSIHERLQGRPFRPMMHRNPKIVNTNEKKIHTAFLPFFTRYSTASPRSSGAPFYNSRLTPQSRLFLSNLSDDQLPLVITNHTELKQFAEIFAERQYLPDAPVILHSPSQPQDSGRGCLPESCNWRGLRSGRADRR
jgi:hypothetical protein